MTPQLQQTFIGQSQPSRGSSEPFNYGLRFEPLEFGNFSWHVIRKLGCPVDCKYMLLCEELAGEINERGK